jgi:hypothetical protein
MYVQDVPLTKIVSAPVACVGSEDSTDQTAFAVNKHLGNAVYARDCRHARCDALLSAKSLVREDGGFGSL